MKMMQESEIKIQNYRLFSTNVKKQFTTKELAKQFDTTEPFIRYIINTLGISRINPGVKNAIYQYSAYLQIKNYILTHKKIKVAVVQNVNNEEAALHPLVKDKRFLKTEFFPTYEDITPVCFLEIEKE